MNIYFSGIGGVGIGPLAEIALDCGYAVSGSDSKSSPLTDELLSRGVSISHDQSGTFLASQHAANPIDWFVYTAALSDSHPEVLAAKARGIKISKRDEFLSHIISLKNLKLIAVAGTHGKTSTTGMLVWVMKQLNIPVSYLVGTTLTFGPSGFYDSSSEYFIYECDEFDRNFLSYTPHLSIITSIDYDHPDTYATESEYRAAFRQFISQSTMVIMWQKDADYVGDRDTNTWALQEDEVQKLPLAGEHNRRNGTLVLKALERLDIGKNLDSHAWLKQFPGTNRRFEKLGEYLYSDYGHHPVEIAATLQMAHELSDNVVLVYQPHQNVRQYEIREQYTDDVFRDAKHIYWTDTYLSREDSNLPILTPEQLTGNLSRITISHLTDSLWTSIQEHRARGDLVVCMGAGSIDEWVRRQLR